MLYDGKRDGIKGSNYHSNCDGKGPNITFIKTNQGRRLGGFTMKTWSDKFASYITDENAFIFDLDKNEKYDVVNPSKAIYNNLGNGPTFGSNHDIKLNNNFFEDKEGGYFYPKNNSCYNYPENIDRSKVIFNCEEMEVYQIIFN